MNFSSTLFALLVLCVLTSGDVSAEDKRAASADKEVKSKPVFAFVALRKLSPPTANQVLIDLEAALGKECKIEDIAVDGKSVVFKVDGQQVMYGFIDKPIPWTDLKNICESSWMWPEATASLKNHAAHLIVLVLGDKGSTFDRSLLLTKLLAASSKSFDSAGVYWGHGSVVVSPDQIQKMAKSATKEDPPLLLWLSFHRHKERDGSFTVVTEGLDYFDCMEVEVINSKQPLKEVLNTVLGVALITLKGEIIKDGDTIGGEGTSEKIKTHHAKSIRDKSKTVLKIDF